MRQWVTTVVTAAFSAGIVAILVLGPRTIPVLGLSESSHGFVQEKNASASASCSGDNCPPPVAASVRGGETVTQVPPLMANDSGWFPCGESCAKGGIARGTLVATPWGAAAVENLSQGSEVWTRLKTGERIVVRLKAMKTVPIAGGNQLMHIQLANGKELLATDDVFVEDGRPVHGLRVDDKIGDSTVVGISRETYPGEVTYQPIPDGDTGTYWANGVALRASAE